MRTAPQTIRLAGEDLRDHRHVCVLVDGPDDADALLMPFIVEGLEQGDRAVHIVDPAARAAQFERLTAAGIDVAATTTSHQLDVGTWTETYLRGGRFDPSAQLAYLRRTFADTRVLGFPQTRFIGMMEWALDPAHSSALMTYETHLNGLLRRRSDVVVCTYDLNRHSARTIADVLGVHPVAIVGGVLQASRGRARASARDRILEAASELFHGSGILATGVDSLINSAGVAKATFYRHFPSKDDLVVAWLRDPRTRWLDRVRAQVDASGPEPDEVIPSLFEALADWLEVEGFRGCPYLNTAIEIGDPAHPARAVVRDYLQEIEDYLADVVTAAGYRHPRMLAAELQVLMAGAISLAVARRSGAPALIARDAAISLMANAPRA
jgi:AcrR family transcriptional regulator